MKNISQNISKSQLTCHKLNIEPLLDLINQQPISNDFNKLSIAAKVHYIVSWRGETTIEGVKQVAKEYGWNVKNKDIESVLSFLTELGLITTDESDDIPF